MSGSGLARCTAEESVAYLQRTSFFSKFKWRVERRDVLAEDHLLVSVIILNFVAFACLLNDLGRPVHSAVICFLLVLGGRPPYPHLQALRIGGF